MNARKILVRLLMCVLIFISGWVLGVCSQRPIIDKQRHDITDLRKRADVLTRTIATAQGREREITDRLGRLEEQLAAVTEYSQRIEQRNLQLERTIGQIQAGFQRAVATIGQLQTGIDRAQAASAAIGRLIEDLADAISGISTEGRVRDPAVDKAEEPVNIDGSN